MIAVSGLVKEFRGRGTVVRAVDGISFEVRKGTVFGLLGPNGAGKTTALRILATMLKPTAGRVVVDGVDAVSDPEAVRARLGYITGATGIYDRLTAREMVLYAARLQGMEERAIPPRIDRLFEIFDLGEFADRRCGTLSTGNKQKVSLARALVHDPPVVVLDEPTAGLDILVARRVVEYVETLRREGRTIVLSTHIMAEAERLADEIAIIHHGRILAHGTLPALREQTGAASLGDAFFGLVDRAEGEGAAAAAPGEARP